MSLPRDTTNCWMTGRDREKLRDDVRVEQEVENPSSENKVHYVQKANRSTSNHNILAAHLYPVSTPPPNWLTPAFLIFLALEPLNVKFCSVVDKICRKSSTAMQI